MTVRDFIQDLILESPNLDADVYIHSEKNEVENDSYVIVNISNDGSNDSVFVKIKKV